jgi:hypothetical protein
MQVAAISNKGDAFYAWGRYLYWADLKRRDFDAYMENHNAEKEGYAQWLGVICYWGASLYVVIEGWETAKFQDPIIDALLKVSDYKDVLRRLRNGTFHYQPSLISPKFVGPLRSEESVLWLHALHDEFCRWLRDFVEAVELGASPEQTQEFREHFSTIVGWLPLRPGEEKLLDLRKKFDDIEKKLDESGSTSKEAEDLRATLALYDTAVKGTANAVRETRREILSKLGLNPDDFIP